MNKLRGFYTVRDFSLEDFRSREENQQRMLNVVASIIEERPGITVNELKSNINFDAYLTTIDLQKHFRMTNAGLGKFGYEFQLWPLNRNASKEVGDE